MRGKTARIQEINDRMSHSDFWGDQERARQVMDELRKLKSVAAPLRELATSGDDLQVLMEFAEDDASGENMSELRSAAERLAVEVDKVELQTTMSRPEDASNAYVTVQAGEGGTDSADWAQMLMRMYARWAERRGFEVEEVDMSPAEEAGIRNATLLIKGDYVYGYLHGETGNHRLIRISPFDSAGRRHTSFAGVDVVPEVDDSFEIDINWEKDVREDKYRSGGAGGQKVNKTESAIRLTHIPTGVVAACQNERSQHQNRALARKMLTAKLYQIEMDKREAAVADRHDTKGKIGFGGQTVRNYVLYPDQFVKDVRSGAKVGNPTNVLDGDIDGLLEAYLRWTLSKQTAPADELE
ncbi:peptide chain release factor 2 [Planctomycetia bacterium]|nr:peptide chain release factor 2 [Planctomycetia bacterium]